MQCKHCGANIADDAKFCDNCGKPVEPAPTGVLHCPRCNTELEPDSQFCDNCGFRIASGSPQNETVAPNTQKAKNDKKTGIIIAIIVLVLAAVGVFGYMQFGDEIEDFISGKKTHSSESDDDDEEDDEEEDDEEDEDDEDDDETVTKPPKTTTTEAETTTSTVTTTTVTTTEAPTETITAESSEEMALPSDNGWTRMESGEIRYRDSEGSYVSNVWIEDGGKEYYVDYSGCLMRNNYSADGYWVQSDGSKDTSKPQINEEDIYAPLDNVIYGGDPKWSFVYEKLEDGSYLVKVTETYNTGDTDTYEMTHLYSHCFLLTNTENPDVMLQLSVAESRSTLTISGYGETKEFTIEQ